jgi:hypothetical protein
MLFTLLNMNNENILRRKLILKKVYIRLPFLDYKIILKRYLLVI